jgi:hypothetical protein
MSEFASYRTMVLALTMAVAGWSGAALASTPDDGSATNMSQSVNRDAKENRLAVPHAAWEIARDEKGDREVVAAVQPDAPLADATGEAPPAQPADETAASTGEDFAGAVVEPVADTSPQSTNFAESEWSYSRAFFDRAGRRAGYLWEMLTGQR